MDLRHHLVGSRGDDGAGFDGFIIALPRLPQTRKTDRIVIPAVDEVRLLGLDITLPLVESTGRNQAATRPVGFWVFDDLALLTILKSSYRSFILSTPVQTGVSNSLATSGLMAKFIAPFHETTLV